MSKPVWEIPIIPGDANAFPFLPNSGSEAPQSSAPLVPPSPAPTIPPPSPFPAGSSNPSVEWPAPPGAGGAPLSSFPPPGVPAGPAGFPAPSAPPIVIPAAAPSFPPPTAQPFPPPAVSPHADPSAVVEPLTPEAELADAGVIGALREVLARGASDLHLAADAAPTLRVNGALVTIENPTPWSADRVATALRSMMTALQREIFDRDLELDFAFSLSTSARFRVNIYQQRGNLGAAMRLIPTKIKSLDQLGLPGSVAKFAGLPRGLVLVTGPTGSGKSTTLASIIDVVNRTRADHIVTVEDPIEFLHSNKVALVNQREVGHDTHSFASALKHVLRQDPDVILVGEMRDLETISVALTAAETGHLVFATLHTQSAATTIDRVIDVYPPHQQDQIRTQLAATLQGVVCQTLVKRADGSGRAVATEIMVMTPAIANLVREGKTYQITSAMQAGRGLGMHTLDQHLAELVDEGIITRATAFERAQDPETLDRLIQRADQAPLQFDDDAAFGSTNTDRQTRRS